MKSIIILSLILAVAFSHSFKLEQQLLQDLWDQWKLSNQKVYTASQENVRFNIFAENYLQILEFNALDAELTLGLNQFADLSVEEFEAKYLGLSVAGIQNTHVETQVFNTADLPATWDWREKGAVNPAKAQGQCGSCWTFSAVAALEGLHFINTGKLLSLSEQNLVDCAHGPKNESQGCKGGWMNDAFDYVAAEGIQLEADYPYKAIYQKCAFDKSKAVKVNTGFQNVTSGDSDQLKAAVVQQPVSVAVQAGGLPWMFYRAGVIKRWCGASPNHGITAVGYGNAKGTDAFIVRNSWGSGWGDKGYVHIATDKNANRGLGVCGILVAPSFPTGSN